MNKDWYLHAYVHPFIHSSIHPSSVHAFIHPSIHASIQPASQAVSQSAATLSTRLSLYLPTFLPAYLYTCISASLHAHDSWRMGWLVGSEADFCFGKLRFETLQITSPNATHACKISPRPESPSTSTSNCSCPIKGDTGTAKRVCAAGMTSGGYIVGSSGYQLSPVRTENRLKE